MSTTKPTILLVPGSFAPPTIYKATIDYLRKLGFPAVALQLPSTMKRMPLEPATMKDDADVIKRAVDTVIGLGKEVVVVCHSYGGTPTTQALAGLKVKRLIYLSAIVPKIGQNQVRALGVEGDVLPMEAVGGYMHMDPIAMAAYICNDMPWDQAYENTLNSAYHSGPSFLDPVTQAAYASGEIPISYIVCEDDLIVQPDMQRGFVKVIEDNSATKVDVISLQSGHCPNWSMPERLAEILMREAEKVSKI